MLGTYRKIGHVNLTIWQLINVKKAKIIQHIFFAAQRDAFVLVYDGYSLCCCTACLILERGYNTVVGAEKNTIRCKIRSRSLFHTDSVPLFVFTLFLLQPCSPNRMSYSINTTRKPEMLQREKKNRPCSCFYLDCLSFNRRPWSGQCFASCVFSLISLRLPFFERKNHRFWRVSTHQNSLRTKFTPDRTVFFFLTYLNWNWASYNLLTSDIANVY